MKIKAIKILFLISLGVFATSCNSNQESKQKEVGIDSQEKSEAIWPKGNKGSSDFFTGNAYNYGLLPPDSVYNTIVGNVYFEPKARSNWHTQPGGQILVITAGKGYHQIEGQPIEVIRKGDVVKCPPNTRHLHGASSDSALHQMYIVPNIDKGIVNWLEPVTDEQYNNLKK